MMRASWSTVFTVLLIPGPCAIVLGNTEVAVSLEEHQQQVEEAGDAWGKPELDHATTVSSETSSIDIPDPSDTEPSITQKEQGGDERGVERTESEGLLRPEAPGGATRNDQEEYIPAVSMTGRERAADSEEASVFVSGSADFSGENNLPSRLDAATPFGEESEEYLEQEVEDGVNVEEKGRRSGSAEMEREEGNREHSAVEYIHGGDEEAGIIFGEDFDAALGDEEAQNGNNIIRTVRDGNGDFAGTEDTRDGFVHGWRKIGSVRRGIQGSLQGALRSYDELLKEHYFAMSFAQATALGVVGDSIAQRVERRWRPGQRFDLRRTAHAGVLNMIIDGIFTPQWYNLVDIVSKERTLIIAFSKAIAASILYAPFANGLFLAGARALRYGLKARFDWAAWKRQLITCTVRDLEIWPPLHVLTFWLLPKHWRPLASYVAGVVLLSIVSWRGLESMDIPPGRHALQRVLRWAHGARHAS